MGVVFTAATLADWRRLPSPVGRGHRCRPGGRGRIKVWNVLSRSKWRARIVQRAAMMILKRIGGGGNDRSAAAMASAASRLLRAHTIQVETLRRLRSGGSQLLAAASKRINLAEKALRTKRWPWWPPWFFAIRCASERRIAGVGVGELGVGRLELIAILVLQLHGIAAPDGVSQIIDQLEDGEGLFGRPVGRDLERDAERETCAGLGHDLDLRRCFARRSDRSCASLRR
jgi:hypothetical protein